jgi:hypothetical protein
MATAQSGKASDDEEEEAGDPGKIITKIVIKLKRTAKRVAHRI